MESKDIFLLLSVAVTFLLGICNLFIMLYLNRRTTFINTVTSERVKWIGKLRENISNYVGLTHYWFVSNRDVDPKKLEDILRDLRILRYHITLQLNPKPDAVIDHEIMRLVKEIPDIASKPDATKLLTSLDELISEGQQLLKAEWDKVKDEAQIGVLADASPAKRRRSKYFKAIDILLCGVSIILIFLWGLPKLSGIPQLQPIPKDEIVKVEINGHFDNGNYYKFNIYNGSDWIFKRTKLSIGLKSKDGKILWERIYETQDNIWPFSTTSCSIKLMDLAPIESLAEVRIKGALGYKNQ